MRTIVLLVALLGAAACGSKSSAPATTPETESTPEEASTETPEGCDQYCADGCPEAGDYDLCMQDCGCSAEHPCDDECYGACMSQGGADEDCTAECGCAD